MLKQLLLFIQLFIAAVCLAQNRNDIVIDEMMLDPTPQVGLPNSKWIELRNTSNSIINLGGWRIGNTAGVMSGSMPAFNLQPDSCVVICTATAASELAVFGNVISVNSFPSLDNTDGKIFLKTPNGRTVHAIEYNNSWYQNAVKSDGGWTLEMIDVKNPCSGSSNWKASSDKKGGTPGKINSVNAMNSDNTPPRLLRGFATDEFNVTIVFDEPLDSLKASMVNNYSISNGGTVVSVVAIPPFFNRVSLRVSNAFQSNKVYVITASGVSDCSGNTISNFNTCKLGLPSTPDSMDVVINEILFNPKQTGTDYIELYNKSSKIINLKDLFLANRNNTGTIGSLKNISIDNCLLFPDEYIVVSENASIVKSQYLAKNIDAFITIPAIPSYPDDKGDVILLNNNGQIIDEVNYDTKWHFALLDNKEGVSLERIDFNKPTNNPDNWTSAASTVGFGTPTYQNSQYRSDLQPQGEVKISPEIFSPDNDGFDDFLLINFHFPEPGYVANIAVYDGMGRLVRIIQKNATCAAVGSFRWDGLNDSQSKVPIGIYIVFTEIFNLKGQRRMFKNGVVVARRF